MIVWMRKLLVILNAMVLAGSSWSLPLDGEHNCSRGTPWSAAS